MLIAVGLLAAVLVVATVRPGRVPEVVAAVPAAVLVVALGLLSPAATWAEVRELGPTVGFLAAVLVLGHLADTEGLFGWIGARLARAARGRPRMLFGLVFAVAAATTAVLSLDATVVLLTPVVLAAAERTRLRPEPHAYACVHLANSASTLLPISNLTNLLALPVLASAGVSFLDFTALLALPTLAIIAVEYAGLRWAFRHHLPPARAGTAAVVDEQPVPRFALAVLALALAGFAVASWLEIAPLWVAVAAVAVLAARSLRTGATRPTRLLAATSPLFCLFVLALGIVVAAVAAQGLGAAVAALLPDRPDLTGLLAVAALAAVLANVLNNLPATLLLLAAVGPAAAPAVVLAALIGVNVGPNMTYVGSLATLLWRRVLTARDRAPRLREFTRAGLLTVPTGLVTGVTALWLLLRLVGWGDPWSGRPPSTAAIERAMLDRCSWRGPSSGSTSRRSRVR